MARILAIARVASRRMSTQGGRDSVSPSPFEHCNDVVKRGDYDGYLYSLLQGSDKRSVLQTP